MRKSFLAYLFAAAAFLPASAGLAQMPDSHVPQATPDTLAGWAKGAQLFDGLGTFHRKITTRSPLAQQYFDQGMRFIWAFNHDEATRSFAKAATIDPKCASCYWGVALTLGPQLQHADDELGAGPRRLGSGTEGGSERTACNAG